MYNVCLGRAYMKSSLYSFIIEHILKVPIRGINKSVKILSLILQIFAIYLTLHCLIIIILNYHIQYALGR